MRQRSIIWIASWLLALGLPACAINPIPTPAADATASMGDTGQASFPDAACAPDVMEPMEDVSEAGDASAADVTAGDTVEMDGVPADAEEPADLIYIIPADVEEW